MAKENSLVEEAIIQMRNLEEAVAENAKGILASTMKQEIKDLVKESLSEQEDDEIETDDVEMDEPMGSDDIADIDMGDESDEDDDEMDTDDMDDEEDTIDLTDADDEEVLRVFQLMGPDDNIVVTKDDKGNTHLKDKETGKEYMIVGESEEDEMEMDESEEDEMEMEESEEDEMEMEESIESIVERMFSDKDMDDDDEDDMDYDDEDDMDYDDEDDMDEEMVYEIEMDDEDDEKEDLIKDIKSRVSHYFDGETQGVEGIELDDDDMIKMPDNSDDEYDEYITHIGEDGVLVTTFSKGGKYEDDYNIRWRDLSVNNVIKISKILDNKKYSTDGDSIYESKSTIKPKGVGMGNQSKFKYDKSPNQGTGFKTKMKQGPRTMGTGKAKFEYKEGENAGSKLGTNKMVKKVESKEQYTVKPKTTVKKAETKEAVRTLGAGSNFRKGGLPKPRAHSSANTAIKESRTNSEVQILREKNEEYRKALNVFRSKLNDVAVFNSNLAYATRLFTEHSTSKQEKINILRRFDGLETIKESKNLYQTIKSELTGTKSQPMNESIERTIAKAPSTGSAINLIESKTYENPQFLRMKDLMSKIK
jgi:hypothetical protein